MSGYVGRDGEPITREQAIAAFFDDDARAVGRDHVNGHFVSTVWLVIYGGVTIPFETMIFPEHTGDCDLEDWQERYPTEEAARAGHDQAVALARDAACAALRDAEERRGSMSERESLWTDRYRRGL